MNTISAELCKLSKWFFSRQKSGDDIADYPQKRKTPSEKSTLRKRNKKPGGKNVFQLNWFWMRSVWLLSVFGPLKSAYLPTTKNAQPTPNTLKIKFLSWSKEMDSLNGSIVTTLRMYPRNYLLLNKERAASLKSIFVYRLFAWNSFPFSLCPPPVCPPPPGNEVHPGPRPLPHSSAQHQCIDWLLRWHLRRVITSLGDSPAGSHPPQQPCVPPQ